MPFAAALRKSLEDRDCEVPAEFRRGDSLEEVLNRHLRTVEQMGGDDTFTCILLLSDDGKRLSYGAAPTVPHSYCRASNSIEIGPFAGSCGAAAYFGQPVYSPDIASDVVWGDYRAPGFAARLPVVLVDADPQFGRHDHRDVRDSPPHNRHAYG